MSPTRTRPSSSRRRVRKSAPTSSRPFVAHQLVPPHEILSEAETQEVLAALKTPPERLPRILATDAGLRTDPNYQKALDTGERLAGRLVRIRRRSATAGEAIAYRWIVDGSAGE